MCLDEYYPRDTQTGVVVFRGEISRKLLPISYRSSPYIYKLQLPLRRLHFWYFIVFGL